MTGTELALWIRRGRERKRWTQAQFAAYLGVAVRTVGSWERGETEPRNALGAIEALLGEPYGGPDPDEEALMALNLPLGEREELVKALREMRAPPRERAS